MLSVAPAIAPAACLAAGAPAAQRGPHLLAPLAEGGVDDGEDLLDLAGAGRAGGVGRRPRGAPRPRLGIIAPHGAERQGGAAEEESRGERVPQHLGRRPEAKAAVDEVMPDLPCIVVQHTGADCSMQEGRDFWWHTVLDAMLEEQGLLTRRRDRADRRRHIVAITRAGESRFDEAEQTYEAAQEELLSALDSDQRAQLQALLLELERALAVPDDACEGEDDAGGC